MDGWNWVKWKECVVGSCLTKRAKDTFIRVYDFYSSQSPLVVSASSTSDQPIKGFNANEFEEDAENMLAIQFKKQLMEEDSVESKSEVEKYLASGCEDLGDGSFDILKWWKVNSFRFPILSIIAREILAVPISTVASESTFSTRGRILDPFMSSLAPIMVEALICY